MQIQGVVGVQNNSDSSNLITSRLGRQGEQIVSELHGRYYEQTLRGNMFGIAGTAVTTSAAGTGTFTGTLVANPAGSGVNLVINKVKAVQVAALTAGTIIGVQYGISNLAVAASLTTIVNRLASGAASKAVATAGATVTAMTSFIPLAGSGSGAITVPLIIPSAEMEFEGGLIIPPGYQIASYTSVASTTALAFNFQWEEVPV